MASRPVYIPRPDRFPFVEGRILEFDWFPGFSKSQAQKSIASLHRSASLIGVSPVLEISSKSETPTGIQLSAFNLCLETEDSNRTSVECAFQGSKVFIDGGPYIDLFHSSGRQAKKDERIRNSGEVIGFQFLGEEFPITPPTAFYDWLYLSALRLNPKLAEQLLEYRGFTDIAFNPKRSINCQARSAALFVSLCRKNLVEKAVADKEFYLTLVTGKQSHLEPDGLGARQPPLL